MKGDDEAQLIVGFKGWKMWVQSRREKVMLLPPRSWKSDSGGGEERRRRSERPEERFTVFTGQFIRASSGRRCGAKC